MELQERVERLERQNRWLKIGGFLVLGVIGCGFLASNEPPVHREAKAAEGDGDTIIARKLMIVDEQGDVRMMLGTFGEAVTLGLFDPDGTKRGEFSAWRGGQAFLSLRGIHKRRHKSFLVEQARAAGDDELRRALENTAPGIELKVLPMKNGRRDKLAVHLQEYGRELLIGGGRIDLIEDAVSRVSLNSETIGLSDGDGRLRTVLGLGVDPRRGAGVPSILMFDENTNLRWKSPY